MWDYVYPTTTIHIGLTAATSQWVVLYRDDRTYAALGGHSVEALPDRKTLRVLAMRSCFSLAWDHAPIERGLRSSRGVSRRVERPPEWTGRNEW